MLTEGQKSYLAKIPEDAVADIKEWDSNAAGYAKKLIEQIKNETGLEVFWGGSLALGIVGQNDIDLGIFAEPQDFDIYLPKLISVLGEPTYKLREKILWRTSKDGHKIDAGLISENNEEVKRDIFFFNSLKENPSLLKEYISLKIPRLPAREYYIKKNEFYNRVVGIS